MTKKATLGSVCGFSRNLKGSRRTSSLTAISAESSIRWHVSWPGNRIFKKITFLVEDFKSFIMRHPQLLGPPILHCLLRTPALRRKLLIPAASPPTPRAGASGKVASRPLPRAKGQKQTCGERTAPSPCRPAAPSLGGGVRDSSTVRAMSL